MSRAHGICMLALQLRVGLARTPATTNHRAGVYYQAGTSISPPIPNAVKMQACKQGEVLLWWVGFFYQGQLATTKSRCHGKIQLDERLKWAQNR